MRGEGGGSSGQPSSRGEGGGGGGGGGGAGDLLLAMRDAAEVAALRQQVAGLCEELRRSQEVGFQRAGLAWSAVAPVCLAPAAPCRPYRPPLLLESVLLPGAFRPPLAARAARSSVENRQALAARDDGNAGLVGTINALNAVVAEKDKVGGSPS
jgi:hypothetical protein